MSFEVTSSLLLQFGNEVVKEAKFVCNSSVVDSPEEGKKSPCPSDREITGNSDAVPGIVSLDFMKEVASWSGESVHESNSELLG